MLKTLTVVEFMARFAEVMVSSVSFWEISLSFDGVRRTAARLVLALLVLGGVPQPLAAAPPLSAAARTAVEADWEREESVRGCPAGSAESIAGLLGRGRRLLAERGRTDGEEAVRACRERLDAIEVRTRELYASLPRPDPAAALRGPDGLYLVRAAVCGVGAPLDTGRVRAQDYTFPMRQVRPGTVTSLPTVAWDPQQVLYRFDGLAPQARYRLLTLYGTDARRQLELQVDGVGLGSVELSTGVIVERWSDLPAAAVADGAVDIGVRVLEGPNAVVSGIELWSSEPVAEAGLPEALLARHLRLGGNAPPVPAAALQLYREARWAVRDLLFADPAASVDRVLFVKRQWPYIDHQCAHRVGEAQIPGANLCILEGLGPDGALRELLPEELARAAGVGRPDLSFDATRIVFPLARPRQPPTGYPVSGGHAQYDPQDPANSTAYRGGACQMYDLYEIGVDGSDLRRLTDDDTAEDTEPCYLPDGRICFTSSRAGRMVQCGDWALVFGLYVMNADGSDVRPITEPQDTEFYPAMLDDGRILYTRWDYVMKCYNLIQPLWVVNPDGTRAQLAYGDWYAFSRGPVALQEARQIAGTRQVVAVGAAHHNTCAGPLMIADLNQNRGGPAGLVNLTPEIGYPEAFGLDERTLKAEPDIAPISNTQNATGWYASPWPLSARLFLVSYSHETNDAARDGYGLYLFHAAGLRELVFRGAGFSCYAPQPLRPRAQPRRLPEVRPDDAPNAPGRLLVQDVNLGLEGVPRGTVRWLRVCESYVKTRHTNPHRCDAGVGSGWDMRGVLGIVPVAADGSAFFEVPANRLIFLEALDEDFLEVRRMRNYVNLLPGETQGCVGCHESPATAALRGRRPLAADEPPRAIEPPPWGAGPLRFPRVVQPVLDRHCIACHDGLTTPGKAFDLRGLRQVTAPAPADGDEGPQHCVSDSFLALQPHVKQVTVGGYAGAKLPLAPYAVGSAVSPLMKLLKDGHGKVKLPLADWQALAAWIDCNAPYYGSYDDIVTTPTDPPPRP
jgi:hypothetical protein